MSAERRLIGALALVVGLTMVGPPAMAQDGKFDHERKLGSKANDFAAAKADAHARANNDARLKNTSVNKAQQAQSNKAFAQGGSSFTDVTVKNHNTLTTGPISNTNVNANVSENKLINRNTDLSASPFLRTLR